MCLLKREQIDTGCGHSECKNYYMLNKQLCVHNPLNPQIPANMLNLSTILLQSQNPPNSISPALLSYNPNLQQSLNTKRFAKLPDKETEDSDASILNKKKMKLKEESTNADGQTQHSSPNTTSFPVSEAGNFSQLGNPIFDNRNLMNSQLFNNIMLSNSQANFLPGSAAQYGDMLSSMLQNPQGSGIVGNGSNQFAGLNLGQLMAQNMKLNAALPTSSIQEISDSDIAHVKAEYSNTPEFPIKEFQTRIFGLLSTQNKMLYDLKEKNEGIQDTLAALISEINILKNAVGQNTSSKPVNMANPLMTHQNISNTSETASTEILINYLYGPKPNFRYQLVLKSDIALPLYRERNFKFTVMLVDQNGKPVTNSNRIPLTIGIYSSENPPKYIDVNTAGNKILKGFIEKDLVNGSVTFEKIQVKEVTSHFRNGWIFFVVYPKVTKNTNNNVLNTGNGVNVDMQTIKPLIVEKVVVKAKKTKEKDQNIGVEESPSSQND